MQSEIGPVDVLINNAGITRNAMLHRMTFGQWREVVGIDLGGCCNTYRAVIEGMRERCFGRVISISAVNALSGQTGQADYAAATGGLIGFSDSLALDGVAHNITANAPGCTDTSDAGRGTLRAAGADSEGCARSIVFLTGEDAELIDGITLSVNGGKYLPGEKTMRSPFVGTTAGAVAGTMRR